MKNKQIEDLKKTDFWNLSDQYDTAYDAISPEQLRIIEQYAINYNPTDDTPVVKLAAEMIGNGEKCDRSYKKYFDSSMKIVIELSFSGIRFNKSFEEGYLQIPLPAYIYKKR